MATLELNDAKGVRERGPVACVRVRVSVSGARLPARGISPTTRAACVSDGAFAPKRLPFYAAPRQRRTKLSRTRRHVPSFKR